MIVPKKKALGWSLFLAGLLLFAVLLYDLGIAQLHLGLSEIGLWFILLSGFSLGWFYCTTQAWRLVLQSMDIELPLNHLLKLKLAADAINVVTPTASLGGDGLRIQRLRSLTSTQKATASVIVDKTSDNVAKMLFMIVGMIYSVTFLSLPTDWLYTSFIFLFIVLVFNSFSIGIQFFGIFDLAGKQLKRWPGIQSLIDKYADRLVDVDILLRQAYSKNLKAFIIATSWHFIRRILNVVEVWLILWVLAETMSPVKAIYTMTLTTVSNNIFFLIPGQWGVSEATQVLLLKLLGYSSATALTLAVIRRLRLLFFTLIGLIVLSKQTPTQKKVLFAR